MFHDSRVKQQIESPEILLIEDNLGDKRLFEEALKESASKARLTVISNGIEAMQFLQKNDPFSDVTLPDLIFLDLNLPKKDGRIVLKEIKNDPNLRKIPVIILTISKAEDDIFYCYNEHANCYIIKPFEIDILMQSIKAVMHFWFHIVTLSPKKEQIHGRNN